MKRRHFLVHAGKTLLALAGSTVGLSQATSRSSRDTDRVTLFLCGDVMTGRGVDQVLPHASAPRIYEPYVRSAVDYVTFAERANGPIPKPVDFSYIWGDALSELDRVAPNVRLVNLETSITRSNDHWKGKGIHYRMHPKNVHCLSAAKIDCCALANNHVLDWGYAGLAETLETLRRLSLKPVGAGLDASEALAPAIMEVAGKGRVIVFAFASASSGVPRMWAATDGRPGVSFLPDLSGQTVRRIARRVRTIKRDRDIVIASIHWGSNWGYQIPSRQRAFAHGLIDEAGVDVVHGHSSHHPKGIEVYRRRLIIYGCGDFINDYEGIAGHERYRGDLVLMYFVSVEPVTGELYSLEMTPLQIRRLRLQHASKEDAEWLGTTLDQAGKQLGTGVKMEADNALTLHWIA
ncbi:MAG: CapA family protein [Acidiferrobacterales bacterium]